ncbi:MAG: NAD(P)/FAD-dependent oxidoreductase [Dorea sp.]|jgi:predicted Rossmann fold flavoprotein|nr:NAD(P)/FAD-dependent oxidoreductase [Dorea sp.]
MRKIGIIGGGAAGLAAAIAAARNDRQAKVFILERNERIGRKLLATGNGRCNLTNRQAVGSCVETFYRGEDTAFAQNVLAQFGYEDTLDFFTSLGLVMRMRGDYVYPRSDQASAVLEVLELELKRLGVKIFYGAKVESVVRNQKGFCIRAAEILQEGKQGPLQRFQADRVILACGGMAASTFGSDGSGFPLAKSLGHSVTLVVPALVQLRVRKHPLAKASGVRTEAGVTALIDGKAVFSDSGEVQITAYGISGIPVFQISRFIAYGLFKKKRSEVLLDFLPEYSEDAAYELLMKIAANRRDLTADAWLSGIFNRKLVPRILEQAGVRLQTPVSGLDQQKLREVAKKCKGIVLEIQDTNGFENAQVSAGGVRTKEVCPQTMESLRTKGLYLAGELLDVDGICGGFNLQWAWSTGCIAGKAASNH